MWRERKWGQNVVLIGNESEGGRRRQAAIKIRMTAWGWIKISGQLSGSLFRPNWRNNRKPYHIHFALTLTSSETPLWYITVMIYIRIARRPPWWREPSGTTRRLTLFFVPRSRWTANECEFRASIPSVCGSRIAFGWETLSILFSQDRWKINGAPTAQSDLRNSRLSRPLLSTCFSALSYFRSSPSESSLFSTRYKTNRIRQSLVEKRANERFTKTPKTGQVTWKFLFFIDRNELKRCVEANRKFSRLQEPFPLSRKWRRTIQESSDSRQNLYNVKNLFSTEFTPSN